MKSNGDSQAHPSAGQNQAGHPESPSRSGLLRAGTGKADITPPLEVGLLMSSVERRWAPFRGVRLPLHARALLLESASRRVAVVSLELLGLSDVAMRGMEAFRQRVVQACGRAVDPAGFVLTSTHTHSAPETMGLSDLWQTTAFRAWSDVLAHRIGCAIRDAAERLRPCRLRASLTTAPDLGIHRRIRTTRGVLLSHPAPPPEIVISRDGAVDSSVGVLAFMDEHDRPAGIVVNAACHPVHEMCHPFVSPDYPGIMSTALERQFPGAGALFLNGADGNVNPPTVSEGPSAAEHHGLRLAELVDHALAAARPVEGTSLDLRWKNLALPARTIEAGTGEATELQTRLAVLQIGDAACVFLPGEPFAETGLAIREASRFHTTLISGYAEGSIGYIPTDEAFAEGGYEIGPGGWSRLAPGAEPMLRRAAICLLNEPRSPAGRLSPPAAAHPLRHAPEG